MTKITNTDIRNRIIETGAERVVVRHDGEVHAYGTLPNSNVEGWYFAGYRDDLARQIEAERNL